MKKKLTKFYNRLKQLVLPPPRPHKWVFIVGCYNSGTTLLHKLLSQFPDTGSMPSEGQFYTKQLRLPSENGYKRLWALGKDLFVMDENGSYTADPVQLKKDWAAYYDDRHAKVLLEKSPTNSGRMRWLQEHFENAHFICIIRNGYAVAEGIRRKTDHTIEQAAKQWSISNEIMLEDLTKIRKSHIIRYEDLSLSPEMELEKICAFIGLAAEPINDIVAKSMQIHEQKGKIENKNERSFMALSNSDVATINKFAGLTLEKLGYGLR